MRRKTGNFITLKRGGIRTDSELDENSNEQPRGNCSKMHRAKISRTNSHKVKQNRQENETVQFLILLRFDKCEKAEARVSIILIIQKLYIQKIAKIL